MTIYGDYLIKRIDVTVFHAINSLTDLVIFVGTSYRDIMSQILSSQRVAI